MAPHYPKSTKELLMSSVPSTNRDLTPSNVYDGTLTGLIGEAYKRPESRKPSKWSGVMEEWGLGQFLFKNRVPGEPLDFASALRWDGWTDVDTCKICGGGPYSSTYEIKFEWGDTRKFEYISEVCIRCLNLLNNKVVRNKQVNKEWIRDLSDEAPPQKSEKKE